MHIKTVKKTYILECLLEAFPESSKNTLRSWIEQGRIAIGGKVVKRPMQPVKEGEEVVVGPRGRFVEEKIRILYEDGWVVVVEKPAGLLSVATETKKYLTAHSILKRRKPESRVYPVHRLDRETSGVMVFAYTLSAKERLKKLFSEHAVEREYLAWVSGVMPLDKGVWKSYLKDNDDCVVRQTNAEEGKLAITHYQVVKREKKRTLLQLKLETGRKNQIRVHCQASGHPVLGDIKYGGVPSHQKRLHLHAFLLGFAHPETGKMMHFTLPVPSDF